MTELPDEAPQRAEAEEYPLARDEALSEIEPCQSAAATDLAEQPRDRESNQFTLRELLGVVAAATVVLSAISSLARWSSLGQTPAELAALFAAFLGLAALTGMVLAAWFPPPRRIVLVAWWVLFGLYLVTAVAAAVLTK